MSWKDHSLSQLGRNHQNESQCCIVLCPFLLEQGKHGILLSPPTLTGIVWIWNRKMRSLYWSIVDLHHTFMQSNSWKSVWHRFQLGFITDNWKCFRCQVAVQNWWCFLNPALIAHWHLQDILSQVYLFHPMDHLLLTKCCSKQAWIRVSDTRIVLPWD